MPDGKRQNERLSERQGEETRDRRQSGYRYRGDRCSGKGPSSTDLQIHFLRHSSGRAATSTLRASRRTPIFEQTRPPQTGHGLPVKLVIIKVYTALKADDDDIHWPQNSPANAPKYLSKASLYAIAAHRTLVHLLRDGDADTGFKHPIRVLSWGNTLLNSK